MFKWKISYKVFVTAFVMLFVGMMFSSCGMFDKEVAEAIETESENLIVVGYSQLGSESVWRTANTNSIQTALSKENGFF